MKKKKRQDLELYKTKASKLMHENEHLKEQQQLTSSTTVSTKRFEDEVSAYKTLQEGLFKKLNEVGCYFNIC